MLKDFKEKRGLGSKIEGRESSERMDEQRRHATRNTEQREQDMRIFVGQRDEEIVLKSTRLQHLSRNILCPHRLGVSTFTREVTSVLWGLTWIWSPASPSKDAKT